MKNLTAFKPTIRILLCSIALVTSSFSYSKLLFTDTDLHQNQYALITGVISSSQRQTVENYLDTNNYSNLKNNLFISIAGISDKKELLSPLKSKYPGSYIKHTGAYLKTTTPILFRQLGAEWVFEFDNIYFINKQVDNNHVIEASDSALKIITKNEFRLDENPSKTDITTSIYSISDTLVGFVRRYYSVYAGTVFQLDMYNLASAKFCLNNYQWTHDGGPEAELTEITDLDNDGQSELATYSAQNDALISMAKITCKNNEQ